MERAVVKDLEARGWEAERRFMSKGGIGEDVEAWVPGQRDGIHLYVQCKADGKSSGGHRKQGMMQPDEWNRFRANVMPEDYCILANGTPTHIKYHEIVGMRKKGIAGHAAKADIEANMRDFDVPDVNEMADRMAEEDGYAE